ncbi:MAG: glucose-1-phosphate cytidylyltransferase [Oscillospiraceae bacterium]|jgi:glucose-1-phosphate cytidylyltransferase|nr:glucose-1-phosphate cytidylyltransferase [Oscillospiraceae bacterium]
MKVVILAGGYGTRISEESHLKPKPMIEIGDMPILWYIMKSYSHYGFNDFIICAGYKAELIKEFFANYYLRSSDVTFDFGRNNEMTIHNNVAESWCVTIVDTGLNTMTGGRVKRVQKYIGNETFLLTYGDGVSDVNINDLLSFHKTQNCTATITAIQPGGKFGAMDISKDKKIHKFAEKTKEDGGWINGGFMVLEPELFNYLIDDMTVLEKDPLEELASQDKLSAYQHYGYWQCMDTLRDKQLLEELVENGEAPWVKW